jgi:hypothetical protein
MNYDDIRKYNNDRACVERDGKFGYIDRDTEEVIPLIYDAAKDFSDGVALVCREGKWGCIDVDGNEVLPLQYDGGVNFVDGYGAMCREGKYAIIDKTGREVTPYIYDKVVHPFADGLAMVTIDGKYGYVDTKGVEVVPVEYLVMGRFCEGLAATRDEETGLYGFIDRDRLPMRRRSFAAPDPRNSDWKIGNYICLRLIGIDFARGCARFIPAR